MWFFRKKKKNKLKEVIAEYEKIREQLLNEIEEKGEMFDMSNCSPLQVASHMRSASLKLVTVSYRWNWFKSVLAWFKGGDHIYFNSRRKDRSMASYVGTLAHEDVHRVDSKVSNDFGHNWGSHPNSPEGKENTAPYWAGRKAKQLYLELIDG